MFDLSSEVPGDTFLTVFVWPLSSIKEGEAPGQGEEHSARVWRPRSGG